MMRLVLIAALAAAAVPAAAQLRVEKRADLSKPVVLGPGQGAIVVGFRRPDKMSMGKSGTVGFNRYDREARDMVVQPKDARKNGDTTTYWVRVQSADRKAPLDHAVMIVSAGDYVLAGATPGPGGIVDNSFCLGAPMFAVAAGEVVYFGDVSPYIAVKLADGRRANAMAYSANLDDARRALAAQPDLAARLRPADIRQATFSCGGPTMIAYQVPGAPALPDVTAERAVPPPPEAAPVGR